jgi:hypothetical protein
VTGEPVRLQRFFAGALRPNARERLIAPGVRDKGDFLGLWSVLSAIFGALAVAVRRDCWTRWPDHLWGSDMERLDQAWVACVLPVEGHERLPQRALRLLLVDSQHGFFAGDHGRTVKMPRLFIYPEPLGKVERLDEMVRRLVCLLPEPRGAAYVPGPEEWLAEEAGAILGWLLAEEGR